MCLSGTILELLLGEMDACSACSFEGRDAVEAILGGKPSECKDSPGSTALGCPGLGNVLELYGLGMGTSSCTSFLASGTYLLLFSGALPTDELLLLTLLDTGRGGLGILGGSGPLSSA